MVTRSKLVVSLVSIRPEIWFSLQKLVTFKSYLDLVPGSGWAIIGNSGICSVVVVDINVGDLDVERSRGNRSGREIVWLVPGIIWWVSAV